MKIRYKLNNKGIIAIPVFLSQNQNAEPGFAPTLGFSLTLFFLQIIFVFLYN